MTILAALLLAMLTFKFFFSRAQKREYEEEPIDAQVWTAMSQEQRAQYQARREADYQAWLDSSSIDENRPRALHVNVLVLLIVAAAFIEALIVLLSTQDFGLAMTFVDKYSVIFVTAVFVQVLAPLVAATIRNGNLEAGRLQTKGQQAVTNDEVTL
jgi:hypothetical protein